MRAKLKKSPFCVHRPAIERAEPDNPGLSPAMMAKGALHRAARPALLLGIAIAAAIAPAAPAGAHGFGQRYDLPLPLSLYLFGTSAAIVLSFVIVGLFARHNPGARLYPRLHLSVGPLGSWVTYRFIAALFKLIAVGLLVLIVIAGFCGSQDPYRNIAPTLVWIIGWVGIAMFSAFVGDVWAWVNPWRTLFDWADRLARRITGSSGLALRQPYPAGLGVWPSVVLLFAVSWTELVFPSPAAPANIAWLGVAYSLVTWTGMALFGSEVWAGRGEVFALFFGLFARFAPTEPVERGPGNPGDHGPSSGGLALRPFGAGLLASEPASLSMAAFILLVLSSVLFDGLLTTPQWAEFERALIAFAPQISEVGSLIIRTFGLVAFWAVFLGTYLAVSFVMSRAAASTSPLAIARHFAFTLVPIAIAYHLAHYLSYLLTQGQYIIPLVSDPFGYGWDLFGTAGYRVDIAIVGARFAWYAAVISIVVGHIAAVYLADVRAYQVFAVRRAALRSQVPLTALMVLYTFTSLSILAEPIVERRAPAAPTAALPEASSIPDDALIPEPATGRLLPIGPGRSARLKLTYRVLGSAFHDGSAMTSADLIYAYMFAYRWGVRGAPGAQYDPSIDRATAALRQRLRAVRVSGMDMVSKSFRVGDVNFTRPLFVIEIYADMTPGDPEQDAIFFPPWSTLPWHLMVLMEEAVSRGWAAFSQGEAARSGVEWLDLVRSEPLKTRLAALVEEFARQGFRPDILQPLASADDARTRWSALSAFYKSHGHFLVTNGPYRLKGWSGDSATLEVFRDLSYPLGVGSFDAYAIPRRGYITKIEHVSGGLRLSADIETVMKFMRDYQIVRQKLGSIDATALARAAPECRYAVVDADGRIVLSGVSHPQDDMSFPIELDGRLPAGSYTVMAEIVVNGNATNPEVARIPVKLGREP